ncbi:MAG TPA: hypothetical protein VFT04_06565, partial [Gemmatimonadales bacterium]|nr:hypothetical protein [Gemmatimonadales bacterium]
APGAPSAGVRFRLYALEPSGIPSEPLVQLGHVDVTGESASEFRIRVSDAAGVRLEYRVVASGTEAESHVRAQGFTVDGGARADFGFENRIELTGASSGMMRLGELLELPGRNLELDCASILLVRTGLPPELQLDLLLRGPNGEVGVAGAYELGGSGTLSVDVNGESYAAVTVAGSDYGIAGTAGEPLPESSVEMVGHVIGTRDSGLELFDRLVRPVETLITP